MKHLMYLLLLIFLASCTEHSDIIPKIEKDKVYYESHEPNLLWNTFIQTVDFGSEGIMLNTAVLSNGLIYTISEVNRSYTFYAVDNSDGSIRWSTLLPEPDDRLAIRTFQILEAEGTIYLIINRNAQIYKISKSDGQILQIQDPENLGINEYTFRRPLLVGNDLFIFTWSGTNEYNIIKYDIINHSYETLVSLNDEVSKIWDQSKIVYDEERKQLIFALEYYGTNQEKNKAIFAVDLESPSLQKIIEYGQDVYFDQILILFDDLLVFKTSSAELSALSLNKGIIEWSRSDQTFSSSNNIYKGNDQLIINSRQKIASLNPGNGSINWTVDNNSNLFSSLAYIANNDLIFGFSNSSETEFYNVCLHDLHDGQNLITWPLENEDNRPIPRFLISDDTSGSLIVGTNDRIFKFNQLLP